MASRSRADSYTEVAQRKEVEEKDLLAGDQLLAALEDELNKAESHLDKAEERYSHARKRMEDLGNSLGDEHPFVHEVAEGKPLSAALKEEDVSKAEVVKAPAPAKEKITTHAPRNAKVVPEKVLSCQKWLQKRSSDNRAREADRRARELQRRGDRDRKKEAADVVDQEDEAVPVARERAGSGDSTTSDVDYNEAVQAGAKSMAARLKSLNVRPNLADKRASLLKVLTCGRPDFYSFNLCDVLFDLKSRGELEEAILTDLLNILADEETPNSSTPLPPAQWLAQAKKMSEFKRLDDAPFKESEALYLGRLDGRKLRSAEAELEAAEAQIEEAVTLASWAYYSQAQAVLEAEQEPMPEKQEKEETDVIEVADRVKVKNKEPKEHENKGLKNTSALSPKVISCQKWLQARGTEMRARDAQKKAKDVLRSSQRDAKRGAGYAA